MQQTQPKFSIIVPVYGVEQYLHRCVDSILGQSLGDFEVLLVDDGSRDRGGAICDEYAQKDSRVQVLHKPNGGLASARKAGAERCRGQYVLNVDGDDWLEKDLLENLDQIVQAHQPDVITFGGTRVGEETQAPFVDALAPGLYTGQKLQVLHDSLIQDEQNRLAILYGVAFKAIRREKYLPHQREVPDFISRGEDLAVTGPLLAACESVYVSGLQGYCYRDNPTSIMNRFRENEPQQLALLANHLEKTMGAEYANKINVYVLFQYFDFLDRAMLQGYGVYKSMHRTTLTPELFERIRRAQNRSHQAVDRLVFWLLQHRSFRLLWLLRKIKGRA